MVSAASPVDPAAIARLLPTSYVTNESAFSKVSVVTTDGLAVPAAEAARQIVAVLEQTRTIGKRPDGKVEPIGLRSP